MHVDRSPELGAPEVNVKSHVNEGVYVYGHVNVNVGVNVDVKVKVNGGGGDGDEVSGEGDEAGHPVG